MEFEKVGIIAKKKVAIEKETEKPSPRHKNTKLPKKESMELTQKTNKKMAAWVKPKKVNEEDWAMDTSLHLLEDPFTIERREDTERKHWERKTRHICIAIADELVIEIEGAAKRRAGISD